MSVALVTGASSGIGREIARGLAGHGFHVVAAGRSEARMAATIGDIQAAGGSAEYLHLDLASLEFTRAAAQSFQGTGRTLDVLVNNAGGGALHRGLTEDGFQPQFGINHLGHFMLTHHLQPAFGPEARIVQVSSAVHFRADGIDFDQLRRRSSLMGLDEYAVSKLANILFVREMAHRYPHLRVYAVHPGLTDTNIIPWYARPFLRGRLLTPEQGADTALWCATSDEVAGQSGLYYARRRVEMPSLAAQDDDLAKGLWEHSEKWCGVTPQH